jgi:hypothetical protein
VSNWYLDQVVARERLEDVGRAVERQRRIEQALAARPPHAGVKQLIAVHSSRMLVWLGHRLVTWGERLQQLQEVSSIRY